MFCANTHVPHLIDDTLAYFCPDDVGGTFDLAADHKAIVNVGAVGQPRDRNPRACWVLVDGATVTWRRVPYDLERTIAKIAAAGLPAPYGDRLRLGI